MIAPLARLAEELRAGAEPAGEGRQIHLDGDQPRLGRRSRMGMDQARRQHNHAAARAGKTAAAGKARFERAGQHHREAGRGVLVCPDLHAGGIDGVHHRDAAARLQRAHATRPLCEGHRAFPARL